MLFCHVECSNRSFLIEAVLCHFVKFFAAAATALFRNGVAMNVRASGGEVTISVVMLRDLTDNGGRDLVNHTSGTVRGLASVALGVC